MLNLEAEKRYNVVTRAIIVDDENRVLLAKRTKENKWHLVGGKTEDTEVFYSQTIAREVRGEIGAEFNRSFYKTKINEATSWIAHYFVGKIDGKLTLNPDEILEIAYVSKEYLDDFDFAFDHDIILHDFFENGVN